VCQDYEIENEVIPRIATCFGGGIGNTGATCGSVVGAVMAIGVIMERGKTLEDWFRIAAVAKEFRRRFEAEMETINCSELTGFDLGTEAGQQQFMNSDAPTMVCIPAVGTAYRLVTDLLKKSD